MIESIRSEEDQPAHVKVIWFLFVCLNFNFQIVHRLNLIPLTAWFIAKLLYKTAFFIARELFIYWYIYDRNVMDRCQLRRDRAAFFISSNDHIDRHRTRGR